MGGHSFQMVVGYRNLEELTDKLDRLTFRVTKEDALDLPAKIYTTRQVSVTDEQSVLYVTQEAKALPCWTMVSWYSVRCNHTTTPPATSLVWTYQDRRW